MTGVLSERLKFSLWKMLNRYKCKQFVCFIGLPVEVISKVDQSFCRKRVYHGKAYPTETGKPF